MENKINFSRICLEGKMEKMSEKIIFFFSHWLVEEKNEKKENQFNILLSLYPLFSILVSSSVIYVRIFLVINDIKVLLL